MYWMPKNTFNIYSQVDAAHAMASLAAPYFNRAADLLDDRFFVPPMMPWIKDIEPLIEFRRLHSARYKMLYRATRCYEKPAFGIDDIDSDGARQDVEETVIIGSPFCDLRKFSAGVAEKPALLLVAPMAGHYATLLRETVRDLLPHFTIFVTDWANARDVPMSEGGFDLSDYIDLLQKFIRMLGPDLTVMGICQAGVPVMAALALMEGRAEADSVLPRAAIVMGSPIDTRRSPTQVNQLASENDEDWFEDQMISSVPARYEGYRRAVYPGYLQLMSFMMMNPARHAKSMREGMAAFVDGEFAKEEKIDHFYNEFFSVMDLTAEFYLQTVDSVFKKQKLARGEMVVRGEAASLAAISKTPVFAVEAEHDDICGIGQTQAAIDLAIALPEPMKRYFLLEGAGHYGLFNGSKFREILIPEILDFHQTAGKVSTGSTG